MPILNMHSLRNSIFNLQALHDLHWLFSHGERLDRSNDHFNIIDNVGIIPHDIRPINKVQIQQSDRPKYQL